MEAYIKFYAQVNPITITQFQQHLERLLGQGMTKLHLLLCTPGGSVHDGIATYNLLKGLPIEVDTYNFGTVDSIGIVIFCAGVNRYSVPHARFLLHPVSMQFAGAGSMDEPSLEERLKGLKADQLNIIKVITATINKPIDQVQKLIEERTIWEPEKAKEMELVTEIKPSLVPAGIPIISIYDSNMNMPGQRIQIPIPMRAIVQPDLQSFTAITESFSSVNPQRD